MASLATVVDHVEYARPDAIDAESTARYGRDCELWSEQVSRIATDTLSNRERASGYFRDWR
jgi:hypothetical protein